jgi:hypothetical protein
MTSKIFPPHSAVEIRKTLVDLLVKELRQVYDHVDVNPAIPNSSISNEPEGMLRILIRWHDNAQLARILFASDVMVVELGPRRSEGWKRVVHVRYQDPESVERILRLLEQAWP